MSTSAESLSSTSQLSAEQKGVLIEQLREPDSDARSLLGVLMQQLPVEGQKQAAAAAVAAVPTDAKSDLVGTV